MNYDRIRDEVLARSEELLSQITSPAKQKVNNRESFICPLCGHGGNGDGLTFNPHSTKYGLKCFGCNFSGDILSLLGKTEGLDSYPDQIKRACFYLGIDTEDSQPASRKTAQKQPKNERNNTNNDMNIHTNTYTHTDTQPPKDYSSYYEESHSRLSQTDYLASRGISTDVANALGLGYDPEARIGSVVWDALIIPVARDRYVMRNTDPQATGKDRYRNIGHSTPYRTERLSKAQSPIFVTEGELDAISIVEAGGEAVALGSTSNVAQLVEIIKNGRRPTQPIIIALDNDSSGRTASEELDKALEALGVKHYVFNIYGEAKDANEALQRDREALTQEVLHIADRIEAYEEEKLKAEREAYYSSETAYSHIDEFIDGIVESANTPATPTGFNILDLTLDGGLYEGLYIVGAITSLGKTTLVLQIADQIARSGKDVLIFSLEMARAELMSKSISRLTLKETIARGLDSKLAKTARGITDGARYEELYTEEEKDLIAEAIQKYKKDSALHIFINEGVGDIGVEEIRARVAKHKRLTGEAPIVVVDYIQILAPYEPRATDKQNTDKAVLELKRISRDFKTPVIGISSLNRQGYKEAISYEAFKESGAIEYGSDVLIGLQLAGAGGKNFDPVEEKRKDPRQVELVILKNRNGRTGDKVAFNYYPMFNYFEENIEANVIQPNKANRKKY